MTALPLAISHSALVCSVGLSAPAACAAIRAGVRNPTETRFKDRGGEWLTGHCVPLRTPVRGRARLLQMAEAALRGALQDIPYAEWNELPLMLCVAEGDRPGRLDGLDETLFAEIEAALDCRFAQGSLIIPQGRVSAVVALQHARKLLEARGAGRVLIVATDSLLNATTLDTYMKVDRVLSSQNSNGFVPGEGAAALLIAPAQPADPIVCTGLGFATEPAPLDSGRPLRGDGLAEAILGAVNDAGCSTGDLDFRITDLSGEQYYFKEAALALARVLHTPKQEFDLWHPAECIGEAGAVSGVAPLVVARAAFEKRYAPGPNALCHFSADGGKRAAVVIQHRMS